MSVTLMQRSDLDEQHRIALMVNEDLDRVNGFIGHTAWLIGMARIQRENPGMLYPFPTDNPFFEKEDTSEVGHLPKWQTEIAREATLTKMRNYRHNVESFSAYFPGVSY